MKKLGIGFLLLVGVLSLAAAPAYAVIFGSGDNQIFFQNFENQYRASDSCTVTTCFAFDPANDPAGFQKVIPGSADGILVGDLFIGVFNVQNIDSSGQTVFFFSATDQFTGYFAQEVTSIIPNDPSLGLSHITLGAPTIDPFGILGTDEMFAVFVDQGALTTPFESNGTTFDDITKATDGTLWGTLGITDEDGAGPMTVGYAYSHIDTSLTIANFSDQEAFFGLNLIQDFTGLSLALINDINECEVGGGVGPQCALVTLLNQIVGTAELEANPGFPGTSPWIFRSNDPFELATSVPGPATLLLVGLGLVGVVAANRRRRGR